MFTAFMPEEKDSPYCPVTSFEKYLCKLHPNLDRLWQYPKDSFIEEEGWFTKKPIGKDTLSSFMTSLSKKCNLSQIYTNHSIRATGATILSQSMFSASQIMAVTGHKSVQSLSIYQRVSDREKLIMGKAMTAGIAPHTPMQSAIEPASTPRFLMGTVPHTPVHPAPGIYLNKSILHPQTTTPSSYDQELYGTDINSLLCDYDTLPDSSNIFRPNQQLLSNNLNDDKTGPVFTNCTFSGPVNFILNCSK